ncbi:MAG TPA: HypC/HybG/HupF family hydrogenase formation chaperone [Anaerolineae bacterium]|nr:HypC/HybG/HupF family hydrogenase formation chaperone [Anaerolineae bacterium]
MCLAIPAKIKSIDDTSAEVDVGGVGRIVSLWLLPEAQVGDYVYVHSGFAISVVDEAEALESLRLLQELAETFPADELYYTTSDLPQRSGEAEGA